MEAGDLHRKAHIFMVRHANTSRSEGRWKFKEGKKKSSFDKKSDDLMWDSPRIRLIDAVHRLEAAPSNTDFSQRFANSH